MPQEVTLGAFYFSHMFANFSIRGRTNSHACLFDSQSTGNINGRKPPGGCRDPLRKYALNHVITYGYDAKGNRTSVTDALTHQTTFAYGAMSRLTMITYPDSTTSTFVYDSRGRRTSGTDQNVKGTIYAYDDADRLTSVTDAASHATYYAYDTEDNLTSISDANSKHSFLLRNSVLDNRKSVKSHISRLHRTWPSRLLPSGRR
jgi:YD repeat-containing protein